jgi:hypothetical protein
VVALGDGKAELIGLQEMIARLLHAGVKAKQAPSMLGNPSLRHSSRNSWLRCRIQAAASSSSVFGASASR